MTDEAEAAGKDLEKELARVRGVSADRMREVQRLKRALATSESEQVRQEALLERFATVKAMDMRVPTWLKPPTTKQKEHHGTPVLLLSDLHLDENVDIDEMDGINEFNREIAEERLRNVVEGTIALMQDYVAGLTLDGIVVMILGDVITGIIHEELGMTNDGKGVPDTIVHWVPLLASALQRLADVFGKVFVPCVDGNHDRTFKKTPKKQRSTSSNAWIIYNWLADTLRDDPRITFSITPSPEQIVNVYDTRFLLSHGDSFRSAGGVGGLYPSMLKWLVKRKDMYNQVGKGFDYAVIGHWHQLLWGRDFIVNGSLKGYDEYAKDGGFGFERPQQALFIVTPENGIVQRLGVYAD